MAKRIWTDRATDWLMRPSFVFYTNKALAKLTCICTLNYQMHSVWDGLKHLWQNVKWAWFCFVIVQYSMCVTLYWKEVIGNNVARREINIKIFAPATADVLVGVWMSVVKQSMEMALYSTYFGFTCQYIQAFLCKFTPYISLLISCIY